MLGVLVGILVDAYMVLLAHPVRRVYMNGPHRLGCWAGQSDSQICASLTGVGSAHWDANPEECAAIVDRDVTSVVVVAETAIYFTLLYNAVRAAFAACVRRREILKIDSGSVLMLANQGT